ncbi:MAG: SGNH/GDSL hydrolase family protein [Treponema sp.]|jgi:lysophospholipase L1-like esterase|nr:SGNH/GDSL hydrolase family protein [Treponema sp.]
MKTIVCYGDSNTWGFIPLKGQPELKDARFAWGERWTSRLQDLLGGGYRVEEEGLNGRTTVFEDPVSPCRNGFAYLECCMLVKTPVDLLVLMLGTNDTKERFGASAYCIASGMDRLIQSIKGKGYGPGGKDPAILVVAPPPLRDNITETWLYGEFCKEDIAKSKAVPGEYQKVAEQNGCLFLNAGDYVRFSENDGIHLDKENHAKFAEAVYNKIRNEKGI